MFGVTSSFLRSSVLRSSARPTARRTAVGVTLAGLTLGLAAVVPATADDTADATDATDKATAPTVAASAPSDSSTDERQRRRPTRTRLPRLTITETPTDAGVVSGDFVGANQRWLRGADGAYDPQRRRIRKDTAAVVRRVGLGTIRYPGGTVGNLFDFRNALGTPGCQTSGGLLRPTFKSISAKSSGYTIDRHAAFSRLARTRTNLMIPMINTTPQDAVDYVKAVAARTGQRDFYVEVGNEPYLGWQRYWRTPGKSGRLTHYILGGSRNPSGDPGDDALFKVTGCNLFTPARADGSRDQTYRPRYTPISLSTPPRVWVGGVEWTYVPQLAGGLIENTFTVSADRSRIIFGNGLLGLTPPRGTLRIEYVAGTMPGFSDFYRALKDIDGIDVQVCSSWATVGFARRMASFGLDYDCMAVHSYANFRGTKNARLEYRRSMSAVRKQVGRLDDLRTAIRRPGASGADQRFLNVTEFASQPNREHRGDRTFLRDLAQAALIVGQLNEGVRVSNISNFAGLVNHFDRRVAPSGRAYLLALVRRLVGQTTVATRGRRGPLELTATRDGGRASMLVVNTAYRGDRRMALQLAGRKGHTCVSVRTLATEPGANTRPASAGARPASVRPSSRMVWKKDEKSLPFRFPAHSVTLLTFQRRTGGCPPVRPL